MINDTNLAFSSAVELAGMIRDKSLSAVEATEYFIERINSLDGPINAVVVRDFDRALAIAKMRDQSQAAGDALGPLHGVPMTIKEAYHREGLASTFGHPELKANIPSWDSDVAAALQQDGAVLLGKTNLPIDGGDYQTYNDVYGTTNNPWNLERSPGGSSGGSAAALAAGLIPLEVGSDIGGSIRNPAHFCGVYGHKPTWGIVSMQGHNVKLQPVPDSDLVVGGPLARSAADLALALNTLVRPNRTIASGWELKLPQPKKTRLNQFKVAIWPTDELAPVDDEIAGRVRMVADALSSAGATVSEMARPDIDFRASHETYLQLLHSILGAGVAPQKFQRNLRYAQATDADDHSDTAIMSRAMVLSHADWLRANIKQSKLKQAWAEFFQSWDILICPQMAVTAMKHDHSIMIKRTLQVNGQIQPYMQQIFWSGVITAPHLPSTVFPTGLSSAGLPIGLQAVGGAFQDYITIDFARLLAQEIGGFQKPPGY